MMSRARVRSFIRRFLACFKPSFVVSLIHFFADIAAIKFSIFAISSRLFVVDAAL